MKNFNEMTYEELLEAEEEFKAALCEARKKIREETINEITALLSKVNKLADKYDLTISGYDKEYGWCDVRELYVNENE